MTGQAVADVAVVAAFSGGGGSVGVFEHAHARTSSHHGTMRFIHVPLSRSLR